MNQIATMRITYSDSDSGYELNALRDIAIPIPIPIHSNSDSDSNSSCKPNTP